MFGYGVGVGAGDVAWDGGESFPYRCVVAGENWDIGPVAGVWV